MPDLLLTNKKKDNSASVAASLTAASSSPLILALPSNKVQSLELKKHIHPLANHTKANVNRASDEELEVFSTALWKLHITRIMINKGMFNKGKYWIFKINKGVSVSNFEEPKGRNKGIQYWISI